MMFIESKILVSSEDIDGDRQASECSTDKIGDCQYFSFPGDFSECALISVSFSSPLKFFKIQKLLKEYGDSQNKRGRNNLNEFCEYRLLEISLVNNIEFAIHILHEADIRIRFECMSVVGYDAQDDQDSNEWYFGQFLPEEEHQQQHDDGDDQCDDIEVLEEEI